MTAKIHLPAIINGVCGEISPPRPRGAPARRPARRRRPDQCGTALSQIEAARAYNALRGAPAAPRAALVNFEI
ncbi:MAG: hypothetical protein A3E78_08635 [Alphaproteobacteria bacterium RIFCSPHIGHO2_12_FULL_63_12]|nr:MAG: hypothetical protein A3E78_08635 [Alphaproteobacteria bacterium RIFCSPHIGHO2_12_FULL_63_12]